LKAGPPLLRQLCSGGDQTLHKLGAVVKRFTSGHEIVGTVSDAGATIHCSDELWFGVGMEVSVRDQNLAINTGRNGPGVYLESR